MFALGELSNFQGDIPHCKLVKPWWDVLTDYLGLSLLGIAVLTGTMQLGLDRTVCMPVMECPGNLSDYQTNRRQKQCMGANHLDPNANKTVITSLDHKQHYDYVDNVCGLEAFHWFASYLPFILFLQAVFLLVMDNFWLRFPKTASRVEHFLALVIECYNAPGTIVALTESLVEQKIPQYGQAVPEIEPRRQQSSTSRPASNGDAENGPLLGEATQTDGGITRQELLASDEWTAGCHLETSEMVQAKTLAEKVKIFSAQVHKACSGKIHFKLPLGYVQASYLIQWIIQVICSIAFLIVNFFHMDTLSSSVTCMLDVSFFAEYDFFICSHGLASFLWAILLMYDTVLIMYCLCCTVALGWTISKIFLERTYVWKGKGQLELCDIPDSEGDLSLLLHLLDQYSQMYSLRFGPFLSVKNLKLIEEVLLSNEWPLDRLERCLREGDTVLRLTDLRGVPKTIFELEQLDILELENCSLSPDCFEFLQDEELGDTFCKLRLKGLSLINCKLTKIPDVIFKMESLSTLNLSHNQITEVPSTIGSLTNLDTLTLSNNDLRFVHANIEKLQNLLRLNLENNPNLGVLPDELRNCPKLLDLKVDEAILQQLSPDLQGHIEEIIVKEKSILPGGAVVKYNPTKAPHIHAKLGDTDRVYRMISRPKGILLIISNATYAGEEYPTRRGTDVDVERIRKVFEEIGYRVLLHKDLTSDVLLETISDTLRMEEYNHCDSFALFILSHGVGDSIICVDNGNVELNSIIDCVIGFDHLNGKPKLFFIQACRGFQKIQTDSKIVGARVPTYSRIQSTSSTSSQPHTPGQATISVDGFAQQTETDAALEPMPTERPLLDTLPSNDMLISYSTLRGHVSWRNTLEGSWYVKALTEIFAKYAWEEDILSLLSFVNYEVSRKFKTATEYRQIPAPVHVLSKKLYFLPGYFGESEGNDNGDE